MEKRVKQDLKNNMLEKVKYLGEKNKANMSVFYYGEEGQMIYTKLVLRMK